MSADKRRRLNVGAFFSALDSKRESEGQSWRDVAKTLHITHSIFTRLSQGHKPDVDTFLTLTGWLGIAADRFVDGPEPQPIPEETVEVISQYLRADRALRPKASRALDSLFRAFYDQFREQT